MKKTKLFCLLCAIAMLITMAACSSDDTDGDTSSAPGDTATQEAGTEAPQDSQDQDGQEDGQARDDGRDTGEFVPQNTYKIGANCYGSNTYALLAVANNHKIVIDAFGNEELRLYDNYSVETLLQDIENMLSSDVDGLIVWCPAAGMFSRIAAMCEEAQVPFVLSEKCPPDEVYDELQANPYFVGVVTPDNRILGEQVAEYALAQGYMSCILTSSQVGDPSDSDRIESFTEVYEAGGGTILADIHSDNSDAAVSQVQDALIAYPDVEMIYGVSSSFGISAAVACENIGADVKILASGFDREILTHLDDGTYVEMVNGDYYVSATYAALLLQNHLDGTPLLDEDGNKPWIVDIQPFELPDYEIDLFNRFFLDESCYSDAELRQMSGLYNPDFDYAAYVEAMYSYSFEERLLAKYAEGKVTEAELTAVGIQP